MKKLASVFLLFVAITAGAESVQFVTTLSSPLGIFNRMDVAQTGADATTHVTYIPVINYCTDQATQSVITVSAADSVTNGINFDNLVMKATLQAGDSLQNWVAPLVEIGEGGTVNVERVLAKDLHVSNNSTLIADLLYTQFGLEIKAIKANEIYLKEGNNAQVKWFPNQGNADGSGLAKWTERTKLGVTCQNSSDCTGKKIFVLTTTPPTP